MGNIAPKYMNLGSKKVIIENNLKYTTTKNAEEEISNQDNAPELLNGQETYVTAMYSYTTKIEGELSFTKGDKLEVLERNDTDWLTGKRLDNGETGYIPSKYVGNPGFESEDWYFGYIGRTAAEKLLLHGEYPIGTYIIRHVGDNPPNTLKLYSLSIRNLAKKNLKRHCVTHYRIKETKGSNFLIGKREFHTLQDLITFYSTKPGGLCCTLVQPCSKNLSIISIIQGSDEIDRKDIQLFKPLGIGSFGTLFYGRYLGQTEVAVKRLNPATVSPQALLKISVIIRQCRHENLVEWYGVCSIGEPLLIITEFVKNGSLLKYLRDSEEGNELNFPDLIDICAQVASGMSYLETIELVHGDLAAKNILVGDNYEVKVADFDLARIIEEEQYMAQKGDMFPIKWTAPEAALFGNFSTKSDVWSYGVLLFEVISRGQVPYPGMQNHDVLDHVCKRKYRMLKPSGVVCPDSYYEMMLKCWDEFSDKRPTFEYLYHFFDDYFVATEDRTMSVSSFENDNEDYE